jgi:hypothetical protein
MKFTYEQYVVPFPYLKPADEPWKRPENFFLPDQVLAGLERITPALRDHVLHYDRAVADGTQRPVVKFLDEKEDGYDVFHTYVPKPNITLQESFELVDEALRRLDPRLHDAFGNASSNARIITNPTGLPGYTKGECGFANQSILPSIHLGYSNTISDAITLAHEAGHYVANNLKGNPCPYKAPHRRQFSLVGEIQAIFVEHAFYDTYLQPGGAPNLRTAVSLAKQGQNYMMASNTDRGMMNLKRVVGMNHDTIFTEEGWQRLKWGCLAHSVPHIPAYFAAAGMYERYKASSPLEKKEIVGILYPTNRAGLEANRSSPLANVLASVGVKSQDALMDLFDEGLKAVMSTQVQPKPNYLGSLQRQSSVVALKPT